MTDFFAAVLAAPDDDAPRLVFADFLTGQGDPRGEFIALQCRLAARPDDEARRKLRIAENKLLAEHQARWTADFFSVAKSTPYRKVKAAFHRGFLEEATLPIDALDDLDALFEAAPLLRRLRFDSPGFTGQTHAPPSLAGRLTAARLRQVRALDLRLPAGGDAVAVELARCPHLTGLHTLHLEATSWPIPGLPAVFSGPPESHRLTAAGAALLASSPHLKGLRDVKLASNALGGAGVKALLEGGWPLESLDVSGNQLDDTALTAIATAPHLSTLKHLAIGGGQYSAQALTALATSKTLTSLASLDLSYAQLTPRTLEQFLAALKLPTLTAVTLIATGLGDAGATVIAGSPTSRQFTSLELGENKVTQTGVFALADSPHLSRLERLQLNDAWLGKKAVVEYLAASANLASCRISVKGTLLGRGAKRPSAKQDKKPPVKAKPARAAKPKKAR